MKDNKAHKLILGTVQMGLDYGINGGSRLKESEALLVLLRAHKAGITELDTAEAYGTAHQIIGNLHELYPNIRFKTITKVKGRDTENYFQKVEQYLNELKLENLEALMFHSYQSLIDQKESLKTLEILKRQKLIGYIGVSVYTNDELRDVISYDEIDIIQLPFNLLDNSFIRGELLKKAKNKGKIIHTRSAFLQGLFFLDPENSHWVVKKLKPQLMRLRRLAEKEERSIASLALNYALQQELIDKVIIGVNSIEQLEQNISFAGNPLSEESLKEINEIVVKDQSLLNPTLWN